VSANAPTGAFADTQQHLVEGKSADDAFVENTAAYSFCVAENIPSFSCYDVMKEPNFDAEATRYNEHLDRYSQMND